MTRRVLMVIALVPILSLTYTNSFAAVGCTLNDPDRDVRRLFPESTGYKAQFITIEERGGESLASEVEKKLGDKLDPIYESLDVPYAYYNVLKGKEPIGRIHGVTQKGTYGGMQLILATDLKGRIISFYYQKISSPEAKKFRNSFFTNQFKGLTLADFYHHDAMRGMECESDKIAKIKDPTENSPDDFKATLRGIKKNLILLDIFFLDRKYDEVFRRLNQTLKGEAK
jgi:hypothetical protein